ncbi:hypothetical protein, partial [Bacillus altitudinis]|uniref:hypothetical protein n=1 Tax=Bacillus altitudinis TaxID=293387 RepID=UPI002556926A
HTQSLLIQTNPVCLRQPKGHPPKIGGRGFDYLRSNGLTVGGFGQSPKRVTGEPVPTYAPK